MRSWLKRNWKDLVITGSLVFAVANFLMLAIMVRMLNG